MTSDTPGVMEATERAQLLRPAEKPHHNLAGLPAWRFRILCVCVTFCGFLAALDSTVVATLLSDIGSSFNASNQASWVGSSFLLSQCCFTPIYGRLSDLIGRRNAHLSGLVLFTTGNVLCGFAPSMNFLIFAQVVAGSGAGGVQSMGNIIFSDLVDLRRRGIYQGYVNIMFGMGAALGGPFGGFMSDHFGWRIAFLGQVPLLLVGMACVYNVVPVTLPLARSTSTTKESVSWRAALRRIDYLGSLTLVLAVGSLILGLSLKTSSTNAQGQPYPWSDPRVYGLLIASVVATIAFVFVEGRIAPEPILPLQMLSRRTPAAVATVMLVMAVNAFSTIYNVPLYFTAVRLQTSAAAGARLLPYSIMIGLGSLAAGHFIKRTGKYRLVGVSLSALISLGGVGFCFWTRDAPEWLTWAAQPPAGWGYAGVLTTTLVALMTEVTQEGKGEMCVPHFPAL